jgi:hypothetical protein
VSALWVKVMGGNFMWWDVFSPMHRGSRRVALRNLDDEATASPVELDGQQVNLCCSSSTQMGQRSTKSALSQPRDQVFSQSSEHLFA